MTGTLRELLNKGESASVEFKRTLADEGRILDTIAGMATVGGGTLLIGVRDAPGGAPVGADLQALAAVGLVRLEGQGRASRWERVG